MFNIGFAEARKGCCGIGIVETTSLLCNPKSLGVCSDATLFQIMGFISVTLEMDLAILVVFLVISPPCTTAMLSSMGNGAVLPSTSVDAVLSSTGLGAVIFSTATARALFVLCQTTTVEKPLSLLFSFFLFFLSLTSSFSRALTTLHAAVIPLLLLCVLHIESLVYWSGNTATTPQLQPPHLCLLVTLFFSFQVFHCFSNEVRFSTLVVADSAISGFPH
ncbi:hypothetical protein S83_047031 [Arachis hypogaea]